MEDSSRQSPTPVRLDNPSYYSKTSSEENPCGPISQGGLSWVYPSPYLKSGEIRPGDRIPVEHDVSGPSATVELKVKTTFDDLCRAIGRRLIDLGYIPSEGEDS